MKSTSYAKILLVIVLSGCASEVQKTDVVKSSYKTTWDLSDLYASPSDENFQKDKSEVEKLVAQFRKQYKGHISVANLKTSIQEYEKINDLFGKINLYKELYVSVRQNDKGALAFSQATSEWITKISSDLVFFSTEINKLNEKNLDKEMSKDKELARYRPWILNVTRYRKYMLSNETEEAVTQKNLTARNAWYRLYVEIMTRLEIDFNGKKMKMPELLSLSNNSNNPGEREAAFRVISEKLRDENFYIKHIYNNIILDLATEGKLRGYSFPESGRHVDNNIDQDAVNAMIDAVDASYEKTSHRYYKIKAKLLGKKKLNYWDRKVSVNLSSVFQKKMTYDKAVKKVLQTFGNFSKSFEEIASTFIKSGWIDVYPRNGKVGGAFAEHVNSKYTHPYILLNHFDNISEVSTVAHELGHGIHFVLALKTDPFLVNIPLTLAETASIFAENLLFEELYKSANDKREQIDLLCQKIESSINSVMRQAAFFEFEREAHKLRAQKELSCDDLSRIYLKTLKKYLGKSVDVDDCVGDTWSYVMHFMYCPFYVYGYAFGSLYVDALYECYKKTGPEFVDKYIAMLSKGGIDRYDVAASKFGLDPSKKEFWITAVKRIEKQIDELERKVKDL